ncbi:methyltransferase-like protein 27 [Tubulanus polymorphus]|uniref:methyltransferase-like protein 27 n=1 Tax=Tubulanus polymorphus TaxID=672921 RepID=UPI003DA5B7D2
MSRTGMETVDQFHKLMKCKDHMDMNSIYDDWNNGYNRDVKSASYQAPYHTAQMVNQYVSDKNCSLIDVGAGTGLVAEELRKLGFDGRMDAIDPSTGLAKVAMDNELYTKYYNEYLSADKPCTVETESFDHVTCCGTIVPGHAKYKAIRELLRMCKPGGYVFVCFRKDYLEQEEFKGMETFLEDLEKEGATSETNKHEFQQYYLHYQALVFVVKKKASVKQ